MNKGVFITATATDAGKTYVSAGLLKQLLANNICAGYYKAAASDAFRQGNRWIAEDLHTVLKISKANPRDCCVSYTYHSRSGLGTAAYAAVCDCTGFAENEGIP